MRLQISTDYINDSAQPSAVFENQNQPYKENISEEVIAEASRDDDHHFMLLCVFLIGILIFFCGFFVLLDKYGEKRHKKRLQHNLSYPSYHSSSDSTLGVEQNQNRLQALTYLVPNARRREYTVTSMSDIEQNYRVDNNDNNRADHEETATTSGRSTLAHPTTNMRARAAAHKEDIVLPIPAHTSPHSYPTISSTDIHEATTNDSDPDLDHELHPHKLARDLSDKLKKLAEAVNSSGMDPSVSLSFDDHRQQLGASQHQIQRDENESIPKWKGGMELQKRVQERKTKRQQRLIDLQSSLSSIAAWAGFPRGNATDAAATIQQQQSFKKGCSVENPNEQNACVIGEEPAMTDSSANDNEAAVSALLQRYSNPGDMSASELLRDLLSNSEDPSSADVQMQITYSGCSSPSSSSLYSFQNAGFYVQENSKTDNASSGNNSSNSKKYRSLKDQLESEKSNHKDSSATLDSIHQEDNEEEDKEAIKHKSSGHSTAVSGTSSAASTISRGRKRIADRETSTSLLSQRERKDKNTPYSTIRKQGKFGIAMNNFLRRGSPSSNSGEKEPKAELSKDKNEKENGKSTPSYFGSLGKKSRGSTR